MGNKQSAAGAYTGSVVTGMILAPFTGGLSILVGAAAGAVTLPVVIAHDVNGNSVPPEKEMEEFMKGATAGASTVFGKTAFPGKT